MSKRSSSKFPFLSYPRNARRGVPSRRVRNVPLEFGIEPDTSSGPAARLARVGRRPATWVDEQAIGEVIGERDQSRPGLSVVDTIVDMPPSTGRALRFAEFGGTDRLTLKTSAVPEPGPGEIRVRVGVAGLNPVDWQILASPSLAAVFGVRPPAGYGNDFSGVVDAVGVDVQRWRLGDRVFGGARARAAADFFLASADDLRILPTPDGVSDLVAGVIDIVGRTASAVADRLRLGPDDTVLIGSAAGGVGTVLCQLAVTSGARVLGSGSSGSAEAIRALGVEPVRYGPELVADVQRLVPSGLTAAADLHGVAAAKAALELGAAPGRVVTIESDDPPAGAVAVNGRDARPDALLELLELVKADRLRVPVEATFALADYRIAIERQRLRHTRGKLALLLN